MWMAWPSSLNVVSQVLLKKYYTLESLFLWLFLKVVSNFKSLFFTFSMIYFCYINDYVKYDLIKMTGTLKVPINYASLMSVYFLHFNYIYL